MISKAEQLKELYNEKIDNGQRVILAALDPSASITPELVEHNAEKILDVIKSHNHESYSRFFGAIYKSAKDNIDLTLALDRQPYMFSKNLSSHKAEKEAREKNVAIFCDALDSTRAKTKEAPADTLLIDAFLMYMAIAAGDHKRFKALLDRSPEAAWSPGFHRSASAASIVLMYPPAAEADDAVKKEYVTSLNKCASNITALEGKNKQHHPSVFFAPFVINPKTCDDEQFELLLKNNTLDKYAQDISNDRDNLSHYLMMIQTSYESLSPDDAANLAKFEKRRKIFFDKVLKLIPANYITTDDEAELFITQTSTITEELLPSIDRLEMMFSQPAIVTSQAFCDQKDTIIDIILQNKNNLDTPTKIKYLTAAHFNSLEAPASAIINSARNSIKNLETIQAFADNVAKCGVQPDELIPPAQKADFAARFSKAVVHSAASEYGRGNVLNTAANNADYVKTRSYVKFTKDMVYKTASNILNIFGLNKNSRESAEKIADHSQEIKNALGLSVKLEL